MKAYELISVRRKSRNITPLESARLDLEMFQSCRLPSTENNQFVTFALILSDLYTYLETNGQVYSLGYRVQNVTKIVSGFIDVIADLGELIGFPEDCFDEMASAIAGGNNSVQSGELSAVVKKASLAFQDMAWN